MSIADAVRPSDSMPEIDSPDTPITMRRGHSVSRGDDFVLSFPHFSTYTDDNQR